MLNQRQADEQFEILRAGLHDLEFEPSDLFCAITNAMDSGIYPLARAISANATEVLLGLEEETNWTEIGLETYRRTFYSVEHLERAGLMGLVNSPDKLADLTQYLIRCFHEGEAVDPSAHTDLH